MYKKRIRQLVPALVRQLTSKSVAAILHLSRQDAEALLSRQDYAARLSALLSGEGRLTCAAVLEQCADTLALFSPQPPEEGWLSYAYRYACACMFPHPDNEEVRRAHAAGAVFFLNLLQVLFDEERQRFPMEPLMDIPLLEAEELSGSAYADAYARFAAAYRREYIYEMMRLGLEATPFRSLEHIAGVHFVAMSAARDLHRAGFPVDLALVSGSSIGHDIGKFGCRPGERVPYLHYYYTEQWFNRHKLESIGHIAANHSVWDLELDNLSAESLLLIYADFRAKQERGPNGEEINRIYSLKDSFDIILSKLDNVDEKKRQRYTYVYEKLHNFEQYLIHRGVDTELMGRTLPAAEKKDISLMGSGEVVAALKEDGVEHNLLLMYRLSNQRSFASILEEARGETNWKRLRAYLSIFETYSIYLNREQKQLMLALLYEQLMHREGDIRRQAAHLMGDIIANFRAGYVKEVPSHHVPDPGAVTDLSLAGQYVQRILYPDHKLLLQHRRWLNYTLKMVMSSLIEHCAAERRGAFLELFLTFYTPGDSLDDSTAFTLLDAAGALPLGEYGPEQLALLWDFADSLKARDDLSIRVAALDLMRLLAREGAAGDGAVSTLSQLPVGDSASLSLLRRQVLAEWLGERSDDVVAALDEDDISDMFLENLKAATPWVLKKINIAILQEFARLDHSYHLLHIATHLSNLLMVSEQVTVRLSAGAALLRITPLLSHDQRNEIAVELYRGLQTGQQEFSKYIPDFLGQLCLYLPPVLLEERLLELEESLCSPNSSIAASAVSTVGVLYEQYDAYRERFKEEDKAFRLRRERLLGMLLKGLAAFRSEVCHEALLVLGNKVFGSERLGGHEKRRAFTLAAKKILFFLHEDSGDDLTFFYRTAALSRIYRFVTAQELQRGPFQLQERERVAFFPGTFDPFTLSHKEIVRSIRDMGFEVMLAIDEFSWSKKTQPHRIRRRIAALSTADLFHVHIFPEDFPVNIANVADLRQLRRAFPGREVYLVAGSDVIAGASSYRMPPSQDAIYTFPHIIFRRVGQSGPKPDLSIFTAPVVELSLPAHLEDISSSRIRDAIDANRDVSNLIDPVAQEYIYRHNLYLRDPPNKPMLETEELSFRIHKELDVQLWKSLTSGPLAHRSSAQEILEAIHRQGDTTIILRRERSKTIKGFASLKCLDSHELFSRLGDTGLSAYVRQNGGGKALVISGIFVPHGPDQHEFTQLLLTEALTYALRQEYTFAFYDPLLGSLPAYVREVLTLQGFVPAPASRLTRELLVVDMRNPIVLTRNLDTVVKAPLVDSIRIRRVLSAAHRRLQKTLTGLYPGNLVLSISATTLHRRLVGQIAACNGVSAVPTKPRVLGENICVPFGKILRGAVVPNTVTKTLHTDKVYETDLSSFSIEAFTGYSPLEYQVRTIRSFDRPAILVDDMLHDGKRIRRLVPLFRENQIPIRQVLVGYLTGMGRDIMQQLECPVDSIYYLPNLRMRFVESTLYPFIGGDTVRRTGNLVGGLRPAINRIFPYAAPDYTEDCADGSTYELSLCCLENARDILLALESEYRALYARNLTLNRLSEAVLFPLCPDKGSCMTYDPSRAASTYLENDLEMLRRLQSTVRIVIGGASGK